MRDRHLDEDVQADTDLAEKGPDFERHLGEVVGVRNRPTSPPEVADEDTLIERKDLGSESSTFIAAGSPIPPELAGLPRRAARAAPARKR